MIKPILKYTGAKWKIADWIVLHLPDHVHYVEPYCGSAAVFFRKKPSAHEVLNDLNGSIVNLFTVIRTQPEALARALEMTPWAESEYNAVERDSTDPDPVEHARKFLIRCWQAHGGTLHHVSGWKHNGLHGNTYPVKLWQQLPTRILAAASRLKDAEIRNKPALEMIDYYNAPDVLLYVDPPYIHATRAGKYYPYEMTDDDHRVLLDHLVTHRGAVVLSGYAHPLYDERLADWHRVTLPTAGEHGKQHREVLWLNKQSARTRQLTMNSVFGPHFTRW